MLYIHTGQVLTFENHLLLYYVSLRWGWMLPQRFWIVLTVQWRLILQVLWEELLQTCLTRSFVIIISNYFDN